MSLTSPHQEQEMSPPGFELEQADAYGKYMLTAPMEVLFILRSMQKRGCMATVYFNHGQSFFLTWILAVGGDGKSLVLDIGSDSAVNREALKATRLIVTANLDNIKIQFVLQGLRECIHEDRPAFSSAVPEALLRLQRREYFRLETPMADPVRCHIPIRSENGATHTVDLTLLDISGGGLSLMTPIEAGEHFQTGTLFSDCRLHIPGENIINVTLCVRSCIAVINKAGQQHLRVGCEFVNLPGMWLTTIQRYITRIERERKARQVGLE